MLEIYRFFEPKISSFSNPSVLTFDLGAQKKLLFEDPYVMVENWVLKRTILVLLSMQSKC